MKIVILAGGSGSRLWPVSRESFPKQFLKLQGKRSLLQQTVERFLVRYSIRDLLIVTNQDYLFLVRNQLREIAPELGGQILVEPERKNTAPAILLAIRYLQKIQGVSDREVVLVSSSDYWIDNDTAFLSSIELAEKTALQGRIIAFGVRPDRPETGYGYIQVSSSDKKNIYPALAFIEKPPIAEAQRYIKAGNYFWNSGLFTFSVRTFWNELKRHGPLLFAQKEKKFEQLLEYYPHLPCCSIDYELMEKTDQIAVIPLHCNWSDVGSWDMVFTLLGKDENENALSGNVHLSDTKNSLVFAEKRLVAMVGLEDLLVVETEDALLIGKRGQSQRVKAIAQELKAQGRKEAREHLTTYRPWGTYKTIDAGERYKVKRIVIEPGHRLSLQLHHHRSEHWIVVKGTARVTTGETIQTIYENQNMYVAKGAVHRLENPGKTPLEIIEVQVGEYLEEDDIVRLEDIYGRPVERRAVNTESANSATSSL